MLAQNVTNQGDVIVANEGVWHRRLGTPEVEEHEQVGQLASATTHGFRARSVQLYWRETLAQHFPTPTGQFAEVHCGTCGGCVPLQN
eukprot:4020781-Prymnesium_polylepis.1